MFINILMPKIMMHLVLKVFGTSYDENVDAMQLLNEQI